MGRVHSLLVPGQPTRHLPAPGPPPLSSLHLTVPCRNPPLLDRRATIKKAVSDLINFAKPTLIPSQ
jgi:hypothetical protein